MKMKIIEMKFEEYVERIESGNEQTKNSKVEKNMELIMISFFVGFTFKEKFIEAMIEMFYVFPSRK